MHILPLLLLALLLSCSANKKKSNSKDEETPRTRQTYLPFVQNTPNPTRTHSANTRRGSASKETKQDHRQDYRQDHVQNDGKEPHVQRDGKEPHVQRDGKEPHVQNEGKQPHVQNEGKQPHVQNEGKQPHVQNEGKIEADKHDTEVPLTVKVSFVANDGVLSPQLEFPQPYVHEIRDIALTHRVARLALPAVAYKFKSKGIAIPPLTYSLQLKWRDKTCYESIEVKDMTQTLEVICP